MKIKQSCLHKYLLNYSIFFLFFVVLNNQKRTRMNQERWSIQEDEILKRLYSHYGNNFEKIAEQMNNIFQYDKMNHQQCEYRWRFHLDPKINKSSLNLSEQDLIFTLFKKSDKFHDTFWFGISQEFKSRPPSILKEKFTILMQLCLQKMNIMFGERRNRKRYQNRIKLLTIDIITILFRLADIKILATDQIIKPTFTEAVLSCKKMHQYLENVILHRIHLINDVSQLKSEYTEESARDFQIIMEAIIFIDTIYRIEYSVKPYSLSPQAEQEKMDDLIHSRIQTTHKVDLLSSEQFNNALYYDKTVFEPLNNEQLHLIQNSEILTKFWPYFKLNRE